MKTLSFVVPGKPVSQGWLKPVRTKDGRTFMRNAKEPELRDLLAIEVQQTLGERLEAQGRSMGSKEWPYA